MGLETAKPVFDVSMLVELGMIWVRRQHRKEQSIAESTLEDVASLIAECGTESGVNLFTSAAQRSNHPLLQLQPHHLLELQLISI